MLLALAIKKTSVLIESRARYYLHIKPRTFIKYPEIGAAIREVYEETGLVLSKSRIEKIHTSFAPWHKDKRHSISFWGYILSDDEVSSFRANPTHGLLHKHPLCDLSFMTIREFLESPKEKVRAIRRRKPGRLGATN